MVGEWKFILRGNGGYVKILVVNGIFGLVGNGNLFESVMLNGLWDINIEWYFFYERLECGLSLRKFGLFWRGWDNGCIWGFIRSGCVLGFVLRIIFYFMGGDCG